MAVLGLACALLCWGACAAAGRADDEAERLMKRK